MTITFIGMPGAGKTCMGRAMARKLGMRLIDGDKLIERVTGKKLYQIIEEKGLEGFKKIEEEVLLSINEDNAIISPGGSAVYYDNVMKHFKDMGAVVYLYVGLDTIKARLGDFSKRGVVLSEGQTIDELYMERTPLMEKYADVRLNCDGAAFARYQAELKRILEKKYHLEGRKDKA